MRWSFFKRVKSYEKANRWYGLCWRRYDLNESIVCPIPFNMVARALYRLWLAIVAPSSQLDSKVENIQMLLERRAAKAKITDLEYSVRLSQMVCETDRKIIKRYRDKYGDPPDG